jgi:hypothetical protein
MTQILSAIACSQKLTSELLVTRQEPDAMAH